MASFCYLRNRLTRKELQEGIFAARWGMISHRMPFHIANTCTHV